MVEAIHKYRKSLQPLLRANEDHLSMLFELEKDPFKLTHVSKKLDFTSSKSHRQLSRLSEVKLVVKDVVGFFNLTHSENKRAQCIR